MLTREVKTVAAVVEVVFPRKTEHGSRALVHASQAEVEQHGQCLSNCHVVEFVSPRPDIAE